jgi:hypothetical protein
MRGLFFDRGHVIDRCRAEVEAAGVASRSEFESGDFFEQVPVGADVYFMRHIIHDWPDELCLRIFRNIRRVIAPSGRMLLIEMIVPEDNKPSPAKAFDMTMMLFPPNGLERTEKEYRELLRQGGFELARVVPTASPVSVIEARQI